ncbi:nitronate monooxygenase family protein [Telluribacter sp. SYSU D00476]|uniref:NAD(P)H-dependent flavin oxidoreductase n=1 Tax=Telluribacter sp. SYSU D00476 TaxID=2811430 RepID=UPI001FF2505D|nr:nitronate monooxygenase [Telluribacter sp. SYSU D00476]
MTKPTITTRLTETYNVIYPFVSAGMAFAGTSPDLAIAVCKAGGIGAIAMGPLPAEAVRFLIREVKKATDRPFHVNFITFLTDEEKIRVCVEEQVPIVSFHWGHPPKAYIDVLHEAGIQVWEQVGSVADARTAVADGIDLIIAQGAEAGGHNYGTLPTFVLVPEVVEAVKPTPVLAAGGITTGRQVAAALCLGAVGVWVGTRLLASQEAFIHPDYKSRLTQATGTDTCLTSIFGPEMVDFNPMRVLKNGVVTEFQGKEHLVPATTENEPVIGKTSLFGQEQTLKRFSSFVPMPTTEGDLEEMALLAGQGVGLVQDIQPVETIITTLMEEAAQTITSIRLG